VVTHARFVRVDLDCQCVYLDRFALAKSDFEKIMDEEGARSALKGLSPGFNNVPHCIDQKALKDPEMQQKFNDGPLAFIRRRLPAP